MIGCVGDDVFGRELIENLKKEGIDTSKVKTLADRETGIAAITLAEGDNSIIVVPGANAALTEASITEYEEAIAQSDAVLLQLEIPLSTVVKAAEMAHHHKVKVILNPAPIQKLPDELIHYADVITPNEHEYEQLMKDYEGDPEDLKQKLVITKGGEGTVFFEDGKDIHVPGYKVNVVDTTGAGDSFNGALAVRLAKGESLKASCRYANAVGALAVTKLGAQAGMPTDKEVAKMLYQE